MQELIKKVQSMPQDQIRSYTEGLVFPANKDQIIEQARRKNLPPEVVQQLEKMPDRQYNNLGDVIASAVRGTN